MGRVSSSPRPSPSRMKTLQEAAMQAVKTRMHVAWFRLGDLRVLIRRRDRPDDSATRAVCRILGAELEVIDDIGLLPVPRTLSRP